MRCSRCVYCSPLLYLPSRLCQNSQNTHQELVEKLYRYGGQLDFMTNHVTHHSLDFIYQVGHATRNATLISCRFVQKSATLNGTPTSSGSFSISDAKICYKDLRWVSGLWDPKLGPSQWTMDIQHRWTMMDQGIDNSNFLIDSDQLHFFLQMMILGPKTMSKTVHLSADCVAPSRRPKCVFFPPVIRLVNRRYKTCGIRRLLNVAGSSMVLAQELLWILRASDAHPYLLSRPHLGAIRCDGSSFLGSLGGKKRVRWQFPAILGELVKLLFIAILDGSSTSE